MHTLNDKDPAYWELPTAVNINIRNLILRSDSYKFTHKPQYPKGTEMIYAYGEFRIDGVDIVPFGLQYHINELFSQRVTYEDLRQARAFSMAHFGRDLCTTDDWIYIIEKYDGRIPLTIYAVEEGNVMPSHVHKDPITDSGKKSKSGFVYLGRSHDGEFKTLTHFDPEQTIHASDSEFVPYLVNGNIVRRDTLAAIRQRIDTAQNAIKL